MSIINLDHNGFIDRGYINYNVFSLIYLFRSIFPLATFEWAAEVWPIGPFADIKIITMSLQNFECGK